MDEGGFTRRLGSNVALRRNSKQEEREKHLTTGVPGVPLLTRLSYGAIHDCEVERDPDGASAENGPASNAP